MELKKEGAGLPAGKPGGEDGEDEGGDSGTGSVPVMPVTVGGVFGRKALLHQDHQQFQQER